MTGGIPHEAAWNTSRFSYLVQHPDEARAFDAMMENNPRKRQAVVADTYDFSAARLIADMGAATEPRCDKSYLAFPHPADLYSTARMSSKRSLRNNCYRGGSLLKQVASSIMCRGEPTSTC